MSGKHRSDIIEPTLSERIEFMVQAWEADLEQLARKLEENKYSELKDVNTAWLHSKYACLKDLKRVLKEGDG